ncbi:MAG: 2-amino-4-hydroxy-6-hydroxymethyldihydropteridine diphosphokinase [Rhizobiales bacterium]|nr:2-amino-4-hydroxy-6-hydroxymethyldihydropteridine diphosphokinase [Hyphomicrobiales bacterium]
MIILSIGSNLPSIWGSRLETLNRAITELEKQFINVLRISTPYISPPMGLNYKKSLITYKTTNIENEPPKFYYININIIVETHKPASQLLYRLKQIESKAGRIDGQRWSSRPLDMDIICYKGIITGGNVEKNHPLNAGYIPLILPHPGTPKRAFVLDPLIEIAPNWHHPITGKTAMQMKNALK